MESGEAFESDIRAAVAALTESAAALERLLSFAATGSFLGSDVDPARELADACLDGLAEVARLEARAAALKVHLTAEYVHVAAVIAGPGASAQECTAQEMGTVAEVAGVLTVSERSAAALISEALSLTTSLPLTLGALSAGTVSWQHARVMVDEAAGLSPPAPQPWRSTSSTRTPLRRRGAVSRATSFPAGSGPRPGSGASGTIPPVSRPGTPAARPTGGWSSILTGTAWPG
ncbi:hypothetical protein ACRQ5B_13140 [Pseudarthrobacter sp. L19]|uniref:hypothetical protein n=1 Tax=Pseudarthrobacter sp. L19 TaxID=3423951 RepID=UPI003D7BAE34